MISREEYNKALDIVEEFNNQQNKTCLTSLNVVNGRQLQEVGINNPKLELVTKFKPRDEVYAIQGNKIKLWKIVQMIIKVNSKDEIKSIYFLESNDYSSFSTENDSILFKSKKELIDNMSL